MPGRVCRHENTECVMTLSRHHTEEPQGQTPHSDTAVSPARFSATSFPFFSPEFKSIVFFGLFSRRRRTPSGGGKRKYRQQPTAAVTGNFSRFRLDIALGLVYNSIQAYQNIRIFTDGKDIADGDGFSGGFNCRTADH